jgi:hypothetical protein|tara:strand:- start:987 stop:2336 length:1350 start_codon:yes stop_codon:yes gene_type:complete
MGGRSSGGSQPTEQVVKQTQFPEEAAPYYTRLLKRAEAESLQPYAPYGGQRIAYFSPDEVNAQAMTRGFAGAGSPQEMNMAAQRAAMAGMPLYSGYQANLADPGYTAAGLQPGYGAGLIGSGYRAQRQTSGYGAGYAGPQYQGLGYEQNINRFMSPFQQNVVDMEKREAIRQSEMMADKTADQAAMSGGLGGYREAILQAERERGLSRQLGDIQAQGSQRAFESAQQQLERERAAGLGGAQFGLQRFSAQEQARQQEAAMAMSAQQQTAAAQQAQEKLRQSAFGMTEQGRQAQEKLRLDAYRAGEQAKQQAAALGLTAAQQNEAARQAQEKYSQSAYDLTNRNLLASSQQLLGIGQARTQDAMQRIQALQGQGSQMRALRQAGLDTGYEDFLRQQAYPQQRLGFFSNLIQGLPLQPTQTVSTYQQQPGLFQQAVGLGLSGLGLYRGMGG